jgi:hypothetical protein
MHLLECLGVLVLAWQQVRVHPLVCKLEHGCQQLVVQYQGLDQVLQWEHGLGVQTIWQGLWEPARWKHLGLDDVRLSRRIHVPAYGH